MQYTTIENAQGICPSGWHIASDGDWMQLEFDIGMPYDQVTSLGLRGTNEGAILKQGGSSGFEALLVGYRNNDGLFYKLDEYGIFATSSNSQISTAMIRQLFVAHDQIFRQPTDKNYGISVRCIKD